MKLQLLSGLLVFISDQFLKTFFFIPNGMYVVNDSLMTLLMLPFLLSFAVFMYVQRKHFLQENLGLIAVGMVLGGAASNIFDVIARSGVVDYISLVDLVHFNLADIGVIVGLVSITWRYYHVLR